MASHNMKQQVSNDVNIHNQIIPAQSITSQTYLNEIQAWTENHKMELKEEKTKFMVFNFTKKKQFTTRLNINGKK